jgi:hypothetical protein
MLYFPSANETIPETCKALDDNKHLYTCNGSGSSASNSSDDDT